MASWAKPGVKCVCVDARPDVDRRWAGSAPIEGRVYTIVRLGLCSYTGKLSAVFDGINEGELVRIERFRPLITKTQEQDIEMFLRIANDTPFLVTIDEGTNA